MTGRQRTTFWTVAAVGALTRFLAVARSLWELDETLFCLALRDFEVGLHHPHPPGFPVYIGLARLLRLVIGDDFRALQTINVIAAVLVFPAIFLLARELRMPFRTSIIAGALFAFFPNVWFFGGTAFSDIPSIVLVVFAVVFLFRGVRSRRDYWLGTLLLALAIGIRPQNLFVGLFPGAIATFRRPLRDVAVALIIGVAVVGVAYGAAIYATGSYGDYMTALRHHADYIARIDSFRSADRPPLWRIWDRFFLKQYQWPPLSAVTSIFVLISIVGSIRAGDRAMLYNFLTFAPFAVMAWLMLDRYSISRFSIGYAPMFALFAADGIERVSRGRERLQWAIGGTVVVASAVWTAPALTTVRNDVSPPVQAVEALKQRIDPKRDQLFVGHSMTPFVDYFAPGFPMIRVLDDRALPITPTSRAFLLAEVTKTEPSGMVFARERGRLWNLARRHYFEIFIKPIDRFPRFVTGWYPAQRDLISEFRWMGKDSVTELPPTAGSCLLRFILNVPRELLGSSITVTVNGRVLERIRVTSEEIARDYHVQPFSDRANRLELTIDQTMSQDGREIGLRLQFLSLGRD